MRGSIRSLGAAALLAILAVGSPPAPAVASSPSLTLGATDDIIVAGEAVTLSGTAKRVEVGSQVVLQQRVGGSWQALATRKLKKARTYAFRQTPSVGTVVYRVHLSRQSGQAAANSPTETVLVVPTSTVTAAARVVGGGTDVIVEGNVSPAGTSSGVTGTTTRVGLEQLVDGTWVAVDGALTPAGTFSIQHTFAAGDYLLRIHRPVDQWGGEAVSSVMNVSVTNVAKTALPKAFFGIDYAGPTMVAQNIDEPAWSATGLPLGMHIDALTGEIYGRPTGPPTSSPVRVTATGLRSGATAWREFTLAYGAVPGTLGCQRYLVGDHVEGDLVMLIAPEWDPQLVDGNGDLKYGFTGSWLINGDEQTHDFAAGVPAAGVALVRQMTEGATYDLELRVNGVPTMSGTVTMDDSCQPNPSLPRQELP